MMNKFIRILNIANKRLPDHDYRIKYREASRFAEITYGLPAKPQSLDSAEFVKMGFEEGISLQDVTQFFKLLRHLRKHSSEYDLVHFFSTKLQLLGPICAALAGIPCVSTFTGYGRTFNRDELRYRLLRPIYLTLTRISLALSKATFFQNHGDMQWLIHCFPSAAHKMHCIGSGVEAEKIHNKDFTQDQLTILMVARIMKDKGISTFLETAQHLSNTSFRFLIVGPPSVGQESLHSQVLNAHNQGMIEYYGELDQQELHKLYHQSHIFAFPSRGEGMPRVMLEAGHALMCPIASNIPAHHDLIHPEGGFTLNPNDEVNSLVSHLEFLNMNRSKLESNARNFQEHILCNYTIEAYAARMDEFLKKLAPDSMEPEHNQRQQAA